MHRADQVPRAAVAAGVSELTDRGHVLVVDPGGARAAEMAVWLRRHGIDASYLVGGALNGLPPERG